MNANRILLAINPEYSRCRDCGKYYHLEKLKIFCGTHKAAIDNYCFCCSHEWKKDLPKWFRNSEITSKDLEPIYGNIYNIKYSVYEGFRFRLKRGKINENR